ncbi:MAG: hypothetical protein ACJZ86_00190 [Pontiellaceae bacterium]
MKQATTFILLIACTFSIYAEDKIPFEIKRIQDAKQRKIDEIEKQYQVALRKQKDVYIKRKDFESAKLIDTMFIKVADTESQKKEMNEQAKVDTDDKTSRLRKDERIYLGEWTHFWWEVPEEYRGWRISMNEGDSRPQFLEFEVKRAGVVTIITEQKLSQELLNDQWVKVGEALWGWTDDKSNETVILQKKLEHGEYAIPTPLQGFGTRLLWN